MIGELFLEQRQIPKGRGLGKLLSPERRRCAVEHAREKVRSERALCLVYFAGGSGEGHNAHAAIQKIDEEALTEAIIALAAVSMGAMATGELRRCCCNVMAGKWQRPGTAHLAATRRAEGTAETATARTVVAERWIVYPAATGTSESRLEL